MSQLKTVISGSYRKHLAELIKLKQFMQSKGVEVLAPVCGEAINPADEFVILSDDPIEDPRLLQDSIFSKMRQASFHTLLNKDGYLGRAATLELGYAIAIGLQILAVEPVTDPNIAPYTRLLEEVFGDTDGQGQQ